LYKKFYIMLDAPIEAIKQIAFMDLGIKRKNHKCRMNRGLQIQADDTHESILQSMPNIEIFDAEDI
jgi:hypothetical protein